MPATCAPMSAKFRAATQLVRQLTSRGSAAPALRTLHRQRKARIALACEPSSPRSPPTPGSPITPVTPVGFQLPPRRKKIGIMRLDYEYERNLGDIDDPTTWCGDTYEIVPVKVEGFTFELCQSGKFADTELPKDTAERWASLDPNFSRTPGSFTEIERDGKIMYRYSASTIKANWEAAVRYLEDQGCCAIIGNCGFMQQYQLATSALTDLPVIMSSMLQLHMLAPLVAPAVNSLELASQEGPPRQRQQGKILVLSANGAAFEASLQKMLPHGVGPEQLVVVGCEDLPGFGTAVKEGRRHDPATARSCIEKAVRKEIDTHGTAVKAIVSECTMLPHYTCGLRSAFKLPVYDIMTTVELAVSFLGAGHLDSVHYSPKHNPREGLCQDPLSDIFLETPSSVSSAAMSLAA